MVTGAGDGREDGALLSDRMTPRGLARAAALAIALAIVGALGGVAGCDRRPARPPDGAPGPAPDRAFYFWRTRLELSSAERDAVAALGVRRLFVRFFDVTWGGADHAPRAVAPVDLSGARALPAGVAVVPVVFLRAEVFARARPDDLRSLADRTWRLARALAEGGGVEFRELQLDCDWTDRTRAAFFAFLERLGDAARPAGVSLSATVRLHQVKYRERTGVPPVERGMLMFYNMGRISADRDAASIFDAASARRYLARLRDYPLPLDAALPLWSWTIHLRGEAVVGLLQGTDPAELDGIPWLQRIDAGRYVAVRTAFLHGEVVREGDVLKPELTGPDETRAAAELLAGALPRTTPGRTPPRTVALFDLSERNLARHGQTSLERLFPLFR